MKPTRLPMPLNDEASVSVTVHIEPTDLARLSQEQARAVLDGLTELWLLNVSPIADSP